MTVSYSLDASSVTFLGTQRLLFRWKGSLWKSCGAELLLWLVIYFALSGTYRFAMSPSQQRLFEDLVVFFNTYSEFIPLTFMLGFYVSTVYNRWGEIFDHVGWIDTPALAIATYIRGADERSRMIRRCIVRYLVLMQAMVFRDVSAPVKKRFPTMQHVVTAGLLTENELAMMESIDTPHAKFWVPMQWAFSLLKMARDERRIETDRIYVNLVETVKAFRVNVLSLTLYDWVNVPLLYTQVVTVAVRSYFIIALIGRQFLVTNRDLPTARTMDIYVPVMTILQFLCYFGWLKVAEALLNPLGEDDDDFEVNYILDRNFQVGLLVVDAAYEIRPEMEKDIFWGDVTAEPFYTAESAQRTVNPNVGSCADLNTKDSHMMIRQRRPTITLANGELTMDGGFETVPVLGSEREGPPSPRRSSILNETNFFKRLQGFASRRGSISSGCSAFDTRPSTPAAHQKRLNSSSGSGHCEIPIGPLNNSSDTSSPQNRFSFRGRVAPSTGLPAITEERNARNSNMLDVSSLPHSTVPDRPDPAATVIRDNNTRANNTREQNNNNNNNGNNNNNNNNNDDSKDDDNKTHLRM